MSGRVAKVCVVGSFMTDLVMRVARHPRPGETIVSLSFGVFLGGKGFNQAIAARRMGAEVAMVGRVGADEYGRAAVARLHELGVDAVGVVLDTEEGTGIATPVIDESGQNTIIIAPRANTRVTIAQIEGARAQIEAADVLLLQLEIPTEASEAAARIALAAGNVVILNPAPALPVPTSLLQAASILTPNENEAAGLANMAVTDVASAVAAAQAIRQRADQRVVVMLGGAGLVALEDDEIIRLPAHSVAVLDTTAAGDAFSGGFATRLGEGADFVDALRWGNATGALAVTRLGAEPSLPFRYEVNDLISGLGS